MEQQEHMHKQPATLGGYTEEYARSCRVISLCKHREEYRHGRHAYTHMHAHLEMQGIWMHIDNMVVVAVAVERHVTRGQDIPVT